MKTDVAWMKNYLREYSIKPSTIRIKMLKYLMENKIHPTVDEIYHALLKDIPTLSKTSVYNTLDIFLKNGIVSLVTIEEKETRYDIDTSLHGHFKCESCGKVYDFHVNAENLKEEGIEDFDVLDKKIYYSGICEKCKNIKEE